MPDGSKLLTLRDAAVYIIALPKPLPDVEPWQAAMGALLLEAEHGEVGADPMIARIAMRQALAHGQPKAAPVPRKKPVRKYRIVR